MPELPEVESIKLKLKKYLVGHKIVDVVIRTPKIVSGDPKDLIGAKVADVKRFAKVLSIDLANTFSIVIHIKLTGQLIYRGTNLKSVPVLSKKVIGGVPGKHTHVVFKLDRDGFLYYNDVRRFGWIKIVKSNSLKKIDFLRKLGPEPFAGLTRKIFSAIVCKSKRPIKIVLMDQEQIGGIGNIYANDALWLAKIFPKKPANELSETEIKVLYNCVHRVLKNGLKYGGASELAFVTPDGKEGEYQEHTLAYGRQGEICRHCHKAKIQKFFLSGRGTYFCPVCQK